LENIEQPALTLHDAATNSDLKAGHELFEKKHAPHAPDQKGPTLRPEDESMLDTAGPGQEKMLMWAAAGGV